jgi:hypothetical protein
MSDNKIIKTSRATEEHKEALRKKPWSPPSALDAPPAPVGMVHRWIRVESMGFNDTANVSNPVIRDGQYAGLIGVAGLVLARIPEEIVQSRSDYFKKITQDKIEAVDNDIMKEQRPEMPINVNRQSRVSFGGGRKS